MNTEFNDKCPYCLNTNIQYMGNADFNKFFNDNIEEYICNGDCKKTFFVQYDNNLVMTNTMNNQFLSTNSLAFHTKLYNEQHIFNKFSIDKNNKVCANCVSYQFVNNQNQTIDSIKGICDFQQSKYNYSLSDNIQIGKLDFLNDATDCDYFFNFRKNYNEVINLTQSIQNEKKLNLNF